MDSQRLFDNKCFNLAITLQGATSGSLKYAPEVCRQDYEATMKSCQSQLPQSLTYNIKAAQGDQFTLALVDNQAISLRQFIAQFKEDQKIELTLRDLCKSKGVPREISSMILGHLPLLTPKECERYMYQIVQIIQANHTSDNPTCFFHPVEQMIMFRRQPDKQIGDVRILNLNSLAKAFVLDTSGLAPEVQTIRQFSKASDVWDVGTIIDRLLRENCLTRLPDKWREIAVDCHNELRKERPNITAICQRVQAILPANVEEEKVQTLRK